MNPKLHILEVKFFSTFDVQIAGQIHLPRLLYLENLRKQNQPSSKANFHKSKVLSLFCVVILDMQTKSNSENAHSSLV